MVHRAMLAYLAILVLLGTASIQAQTAAPTPMPTIPGYGNGTCVPIVPGDLLFCHTINYTAWLEPGDTPFSLDREAQNAYLSQGLVDCTDEARSVICANVFRECSDVGAPLPVCVNVCENLVNCLQTELSCDDSYVAEGPGVECTFVTFSGASHLAASAFALLALLAAVLLA